MDLFKKVKNLGNLLGKKKMLVIAEKFNVAADYSKAMKCNSRQDGYFEGKQYIITWAIGHLCTLYEPEDYNDAYKKWSMDHLPIIPNGFWVKIRKGMQQRSQFNIIKELIDRNDIESVCIGTDPEREGELIGRYLLMAAENKKPVFRLWVNNSLVERDIIEGFKSIKPAELYENLYQAAQARDEIDWLIGYNFSRVFSLKERKQYSVGRCKTVVLSLVCKREEEIQNFKTERFFQVYSEFTNKQIRYNGIWVNDGNTRINNELEALKIKKDVENCEGRITGIDKEKKSQDPPILYNLTDIQRIINRKYGYTADDVYNIMQKLYEEYKVISYPRTDSNYIKESMKCIIPEVLGCLEFGRFKDVISSCRSFDKEIVYKRIVNDSKVGEHTAVIPVINEKMEALYASFDEKERNVFNEIAYNFLANFFNDYSYNSISILTKVKEHNFITNTIHVVNPGWRVLYKDIKEESEEILNVEVGNKVITEKALIKNKKTDPPLRYTDDTLLAAMENPVAAAADIENRYLKKILREHGIGTSATRAGIIKDLVDRDYILRDKQYFIPTIEGRELINSITIEKIKTPEFTAEIEEALENIALGKRSKDDVMKWIMKFVTEGIEQIKNEIELCSINKKSKVIEICPWCGIGKIVAAGDKGYGCTELKNGCRFYVSRIILGVVIEELQVKKLSREGKTDILQGFQGEKGKFNARIISDKINKKTNFQYK